MQKGKKVDTLFLSPNFTHSAEHAQWYNYIPILRYKTRINDFENYFLKQAQKWVAASPINVRMERISIRFKQHCMAV